MFFVKNERAGGNLFNSFDTVNERDKSRIKTRPVESFVRKNINAKLRAFSRQSTMHF